MLILGLIVAVGVSDVIGAKVFELVVIGYFCTYFVAAVLLFLFGLSGYRHDKGLAKAIDAAGVTVSAASVLITLGHFVAAS